MGAVPLPRLAFCNAGVDRVWRQLDCVWYRDCISCEEGRQARALRSGQHGAGDASAGSNWSRPRPVLVPSCPPPWPCGFSQGNGPCRATGQRAGRAWRVGIRRATVQVRLGGGLDSYTRLIGPLRRFCGSNFGRSGSQQRFPGVFGGWRGFCAIPVHVFLCASPGRREVVIGLQAQPEGSVGPPGRFQLQSQIGCDVGGTIQHVR